jgi:DNA-binding transcriptional ArsR family regulator
VQGTERKFARKQDTRKESGMTSAEAGLLVLGDRNRLKLLRLLLERPAAVNELMGVSGLSQSLVSHHLAVLARHGWVVADRQGRRRVYRLAPTGSVLAPLARWIRQNIGLPEDWSSRRWPAGGTSSGRGVSSDLEDFLL